MMGLESGFHGRERKLLLDESVVFVHLEPLMGVWSPRLFLIIYKFQLFSKISLKVGVIAFDFILVIFN